MYVSRLELTNIRCYERADVRFSPTITLLAGENNTGKSTILQAVYMLQVGVIGPDSVRHGFPSGSIHMLLEATVPERFPQGVREYMTRMAGKPLNVHIDFNFQPGQTVHYMVGEGVGRGSFEHFAQTQPYNHLIPYLSERRAASYAENVGSQFAFSAAGTLQHLNAKVDRCISSEELREPFRDACRSVLGFIISMHPTPNGKMAGLEVSAQRQRYIPITRLGSGVAQALGLIVELLTASEQLFIVEELENDLHPTALRSLMNLVEDSSKRGNQFIMSTHSNVVLRRLGSVQGARVWQTKLSGSHRPPRSEVSEVAASPAERRALLQSLGYDLSDYELYDAWLILEESSAEAIVREFIVPWFAPKLNGRIRTVAAMGTSDVGPRFIDLHRLFLFTHLEPAYKGRSWAIADGDEAGVRAINELAEAFRGWSREHFLNFRQPAFEHYYPPTFRGEALDILAIPDHDARRAAKDDLVRRVIEWLREDKHRGRAALEESAADVIDRIREIEKAVTAPTA